MVKWLSGFVTPTPCPFFLKNKKNFLIYKKGEKGDKQTLNSGLANPTFTHSNHTKMQIKQNALGCGIRKRRVL